MKFHRIAIENINSLYGRQEIDFDEEFEGVPLYLIMGPTGSGKTTILDAVCLALFGETPRQEDADGGVAGIGARVNSYGTGYSRAEVDFSLLEQDESREGAPRVRNRYRAIWDFHRAHKKPDGNPRPPERELKKKNGSDSWDVLTSTSTKKKYEKKFNAVLDEMELEDFLRSIMLAQGEFDELLTASHEEKAAILERLTDTSEYQELGRRASIRFSQEKKALDELETRLENFDGASAEEIEREKRRLADYRWKRERLAGWKATAERYLEWLEKRERLAKEHEEAEEALEAATDERKEHAEDFARLEADRRAAPARDSLREVQRLEEDIEGLEEKLPALVEQVEEAEAALEEKKEAVSDRQEALEEAEEALEERKPEIERGKKLTVRLEGAEERAEELDAEIETLETKLEEDEAGVEEAAKALERAEEALEAKKSALEETPDAEALENELTGLKAEFENVTEQEERVDGHKARVDEVARKLEAKREEVEQKEEALEAKNEAIEPLVEQFEEAENRLNERVGEAEGVFAKADALDEQRAAADEARQAAEDLQKELAKREEKASERAELAEQLEEAREELKSAEEIVETLDERGEDVEERLRRLGMELQAVDLRRELADGEECPVCGGTDHPRLDGEEVAFDDEEEALVEQRQQAKAERDDIAEEQQAAEAALEEKKERVGKLELRLENADEQIEALGEEVDQRRRALTEAAGEWLTADLEGSLKAEDVEGIVAESAGRVERLEEEKEALVEARDAFESAKKATEEAQEEVDGLETVLERAADRVEDLEERKDEEIDDLKAERERLREARRELKGKFDADGVEVPTKRPPEGQTEPIPDFERALETAGEKVEAWKAARAELEAAEEAHEEAEEALEKAEETRARRQKELKETQMKREDVGEKIEELGDELEELFDGDDPSTVEEELTSAVDTARKAKEEAQKALNDAEKAVTEAKKDRKNAAEQLETKQTELEEAQEDLDEALDGIEEMKTVEEVESALLEREERESLAETCEAIEQAIRDAEGQVERLKEEREAHAEDRPDGMDPADYDVETLEAAKTDLDQAISAADQHVGGLENQIEQMEQSRDERRKLEAERDDQKTVFELWKRMNGLIGVRGGEKFKEFAQALNLDEIVDRANLRLEDLHDRYQLRTRRDAETNLPTLDFEVIDRHHAGRARPLTTLSGGETFLVSLALALALADKQKIEMPIETLFLDEGFGTLDRDSLQNAVEILKNLRAGGQRTVGVISHVEALREKIPDQIVVERQQEGRSKITIPDGE